MISLKINCFDSTEQAEEFVKWLSSTGEQIFNETKNKSTKELKVDVKSSFDKGKILWSGQTAVLVLRELTDKSVTPLPEIEVKVKKSIDKKV